MSRPVFGLLDERDVQTLERLERCADLGLPPGQTEGEHLAGQRVWAFE
jgi:hypothetical protein